MSQLSKDLGGGLVLRSATAADVEALVAFNGDVLRHQDATEPDPQTAAWTRDLMEHRHPRVDVADFTVVEDVRTGRVVSSLCLIAQPWSYGGIPVSVAQPELVGTHPDFRGRGLVREQFAVIHQQSIARAHQMLVIDGIPWFYRQFGYEMALALRGGRSVDFARLAVPRAAAVDRYRVRPAREPDVPFIAPTYERGAARYLVACARDDALWRYELHGRSEMNMYRAELRVVEAMDGHPVGFLAHLPRLIASTLWVIAFELRPGVAWPRVTPSVLQYLRATGVAYAARAPANTCVRVGFWFDTEHPLYAAIEELAPRAEPPYAWYVRVPDLPGFIRHIAAVLERRLAASALNGHSGELPISFYRNGVRLVFERGRLTQVASWQQPLQLAGVERGQPTMAPRAGAGFPGLTFLQLLFGYRSLEEIEAAFADCLVRTDAARALLLALFPKQPSAVWPVL